MAEPQSEWSCCLGYSIFWDIENCRLPPTQRAIIVVQRIRRFIADKFGTRIGHRCEPCVFCCSCDTRNLDPKHVEGLNRSGIDILHVNPTRNQIGFKVNADSKLMEGIVKFVEHHSPRSLIFVITGDVDFAPAIRSAKRKGFDVILLFGNNTSPELLNSATESHSFNSICNSEIDSNNLMAINPNPNCAINLSLSTSTSAFNSLNGRQEPINTRANGVSNGVSNGATEATLSPNANKTVDEIQVQSTRSSQQKEASNGNNSESFEENVNIILEFTHFEVTRDVALHALREYNNDIECAIDALFQ